MKHKILVFLLVPHSSYITQLLDATIFGPLKRILSGLTAPLFQLEMSKLPKDKWIEAYYKAHLQAFSVKNIKAEFSSTSIYPFNSKKALNRVHFNKLVTSASLLSTELPTTLPSNSTSVATITSFSTQILTSSPSDFSHLQSANSVLNYMVDCVQLLPTPACQFIRCVTSASEKLFTWSSILQEQTEAQEALLAKWKQRESVKRSLIKGKGLISMPEIHAAKAESEHNSKRKRQKRTAHTFLR